ncbi:MAG TPA: hypothetical protein VK653_05715 [Xanthobacteraceae bacterium]|nr:hypothetical protein [Xanthobacteraceae bacterium]
MRLEIGSRANKIASLVGPSAAAAKLLSKDEARRIAAKIAKLPESAARRFPPPWSIEEQSACFVVRDHNG